MKTKTKKELFFILWIVFSVVTFAGASYVWLGKTNNLSYALIPMLFAILFGELYKRYKKEI